MDPILFRVVSPQKTRLVRIPRMHVLLCYGCPCVRHLSWNTCLSVDQEVSLEVAQASKIWICRTIFRCTVRTHVVCGDCFPLNLHGGGDNYIHITTIDYNTWGRCGINMTFNFLFIIGDELKTEKKKTSNMFDAYNTKQMLSQNIVWKSVWKDAKITCKPPNEKAGDVFSVCTLAAWYLATKDARWVRWSPCSGRSEPASTDS